VVGDNATAGIFVTFPQPYLTTLGGFVDQVRSVSTPQLIELMFILIGFGFYRAIGPTTYSAVMSLHVVCLSVRPSVRDV